MSHCVLGLADGQKAEKKDNVDEAPLQAVILADSYNRRFEVLCSDTPRILLPLCSTSLLTWTLEALSLSKVKQVFVFCGVHANQVREFVA
jgi:translation initiation factor eIF-2B subunit epsilon